MAKSSLLVHPSKPDADGRIHRVTPESAGWTYVGFEVYDLVPGAALSREAGDREVCVVILSGRARVGANGADFGAIGARASVFDGLPWSFYVPAGARWSAAPEDGPCELAVCTAPGPGNLPARAWRTACSWSRA